MAPNSQELYVLQLFNLPLAEAKRKLWKDGFLVAVKRPRETAADYWDEEGDSFCRKDRAGKLLAELETDGEHIKTISFFDTNTTTGKAVPIPTDRIFVSG